MALNLLEQEKPAKVDIQSRCLKAGWDGLQVTFHEGGIQEAFCTCPCDWGGYCKNIIALTLTFIHNPDVFIDDKSVEKLLSNMDKKSLVRLIERL